MATVMYQEVSDPDSKELHLRSLLKYQEKQRTPTPVKSDKIKFMLDWHHAVIRELVSVAILRKIPLGSQSGWGTRLPRRRPEKASIYSCSCRFCSETRMGSSSSTSLC